MRYKVLATNTDITQNTTIRPEKKYGAWMCVNTGTGVANVMGYELQPGEGLNFLDAVEPGSSWDTPIQVILAAGAKVRMTRLQYTSITDDNRVGSKER